MPEAGCDAGALLCSGTCVPNDVHNCGQCGHDCTTLPHVGDPGGVTCDTTTGTCTVPLSACTPGYAHCTSNPDDGCETVVDTPGRCGTCTTMCTGGTPVCSPAPADAGVAYQCVSGCSPPTPTYCPTDAGGTCSDTTSDPFNCGSCGNVCTTSVANATPSCSSNTCGYTCDSSYTSCAGGCWDTLNDANHCGAGCSACTTSVLNAMPTCSSGSCSYACDSGFTACASGCWNTSTDALHCGSSCSACPTGGACTSGNCTCPNGTSVCNGACVSLDTAANCGSCGHSCGSGTCSSGLCQPFSVVPNAGGTVNYIAAVLTSSGGPAQGVAWSVASSTGSVSYCSVPTCATIKPLGTAQNFPAQLFVDGVGSTVVWWASKGGGTLSYNSEPNPLSSSVTWLTGLTNPVGVALVYSTGVSFVSDTSTVQMVPNGTQTSSPWITGFSSAGLLALDSTYLYATDTGNGRVVSCALSGACGGSPHVVAGNLLQGTQGPAGLYADGTNVWFTVPGSSTSTGAVYKCGAGTPNCGTPPMPFYSPAAAANAVVSDVSLGNVYWVVAPTGIYSCPISPPISGCTPTLIVSGVASSGGNALSEDATYLYFADASGGISAVAK